MDIGSISGFGDHLRLAAFSPAFVLHQAKVDIEQLFLGCLVENEKLVRLMEIGMGRSR
jgi:hypothetical protein